VKNKVGIAQLTLYSHLYQKETRAKTLFPLRFGIFGAFLELLSGKAPMKG
jgi:hypothetical protein